MFSTYNLQLIQLHESEVLKIEVFHPEKFSLYHAFVFNEFYLYTVGATGLENKSNRSSHYWIIIKLLRCLEGS